MIVKVCGMVEGGNIRDVETAGADWMGFIFVEKSPRCVKALPCYLPSRSKRVGVFVNASIAYITEKIRTFALDIVQLHGNESPGFCQELRESAQLSTLKIMKMMPVATKDDLKKTEEYAPLVDYFLFETKEKTKGATYYGGSGKQFDWNVLDHYQGPTPFLLTGGIGPDDVENIRTFRHPQMAGIDLNSRFEISPGLKDAPMLRQFIKDIRAV